MKMLESLETGMYELTELKDYFLAFGFWGRGSYYYFYQVSLVVTNTTRLTF